MRRLLALMLLLQALHVGVAHAAKQPLLQLVVDRTRTWRCTPARAAASRWSTWSAATRPSPCCTAAPTGTRCARRAARKAGRGARIWRVTQLAVGEPAPIPPYPDFATPPLGARRGLRRLQPPEPGHRVRRLRPHRQPRRRGRAAAGARHARQPLRRHHRSAAYVHARMEVVLADRRDRHRLSAHRRQGARRRRSRAPTRWPMSRSARAGSSPGASCGAPTGATTSSSTS